MNQEYFEHLSSAAKKAQEPLQELAELNVKTIQNFSYLKPEELSKVKKPEELLEKQIEMAVENGHKALDYMQKSFQIVEKSMLTMLQETKKAGKEAAKK